MPALYENKKSEEILKVGTHCELLVQSLATSPRQMYSGWVYRFDNAGCVEQRSNVFISLMYLCRVLFVSIILILRSALRWSAKTVACTPRFLCSTTKRSSKSGGVAATAQQGSRLTNLFPCNPMRLCCLARSPPRWICETEIECMWSWIFHLHSLRFWKGERKRKRKIWKRIREWVSYSH